MDDESSVFWKFVHVVTAQLDDRPWSEKQREGGEDSHPAHHCKHLPLGLFRVKTGNLKGNLKSKQNRWLEKKDGLPILVLAAVFMRWLCAKNSIVGNVIRQKWTKNILTNLQSRIFFLRSLYFHL